CVLLWHGFALVVPVAAPGFLPPSPTRRSSDLQPQSPGGDAPRDERSARLHRRDPRRGGHPRDRMDADRCNPLGLDRALDREERVDRKSTRLNSSHVKISYAVFCLKKKMRKFAL